MHTGDYAAPTNFFNVQLLLFEYFFLQQMDTEILY